MERGVIHIAFQTAITQTDIQSSPSDEYKGLLKDNEKIAITIPKYIIENKDLDILRIAIFSLCYVRRGQDNIFYISINTIVNWLRMKTNIHKGRINYKILEILYSLKDAGYISFDKTYIERESDGEISILWDMFFPVKFNYDKVQYENNYFKDGDKRKQYATIYWDEVLKIISYKNPKRKSSVAKDNPVVLLVFSYLKMKIGKKTMDWIAACDLYYKQIASGIGISDKKVSECIQILSDLGLIYYENLKAVKIGEDKFGNDKYRRNTTIFTATYDRGYMNGQPVLISNGERFYMNEVHEYKKRKLEIND